MDRLPALAHFLTTNDAPEPFQLNLVRKEFQAIDEEVQSLRQRLAPLERARQECLTLLSPLRQIPIDVLGVIIRFSVDPIMSSAGRDDLISLCLVCKSWRQAALATHCLWSTLKIEMEFTPLVHDQAARWFRRSGVLPRTLTVFAANDKCYHSGSIPDCRLGGGSLPKFLARGPPIAHLTISCCDSTCLLRLQTLICDLQLQNHTFASTSLSLTVRERWSEYAEVDDRSAVLWRLPPITAFSLNLPALPDHMDEECIIWIPPDFLQRLTTFTFSCDWDGRKVLEVLQSCQNLEVLNLDFKAAVHVWEDNGGQGPAGDGKAVLPKLHTLRFRRLFDPAFSNMVRHFSAPILAELDLSFVESGGATALQGALVEFLQRRAPGHKGLRRLRLHAAQISGASLRAVYEEAQLRESLRHLTLDDVKMAPWTELRVFSELCAIAPALTTLEMLNFGRRIPTQVLNDLRNGKPLENGGGATLTRRVTVTYRS